MILSPTSDLSEAETNKIKAYLLTGGNALFITDYSKAEMQNLKSLLNYYGIEEKDGVIMEGSSKNYVQVPYYLVPTINSTEVTTDMNNGSAYVLMAGAQGLVQAADIRDSIVLTEVLSTTSSSYVKKDVENMQTYAKEDDDESGPFAVGMLATEEITLTDELIAQADELKSSSELNIEELGAVSEDTETEEETEEDTETSDDAEAAQTKLAVYSSSALLDSSSNQMVSGGNYKLFINTLSWMCGHETTISIPVKSMSVEYLTVTAASCNFWSILVIAVIPVAFLIYGLYVWLKRRKK